MGNFLSKAGICSMETTNRVPRARVAEMARYILTISLVAFSFVTFAAGAKGKASPHRAQQPKPETMPISANYPASRALYEEAMIDLENLRLDEAVKSLRDATERDPQFALAHAWLFFTTN